MKWLKEVDQTVFLELCQVLKHNVVTLKYPSFILLTRVQQIERVRALKYAACMDRHAQVFGILGMAGFTDNVCTKCKYLNMHWVPVVGNTANTPNPPRLLPF